MSNVECKVNGAGVMTCYVWVWTRETGVMVNVECGVNGAEVMTCYVWVWRDGSDGRRL